MHTQATAPEKARRAFRALALQAPKTAADLAKEPRQVIRDAAMNYKRSDTPRHAESAAALLYPQSPATAKQTIFRQGHTLKSWAEQMGFHESTVRTVLHKKPTGRKAGKLFNAAIALGLLPEHPQQCAALDPSDRALSLASLCNARLVQAGVQVVEMDANASPLPFFKVAHGEFLDTLGADKQTLLKDGGTTWLKASVVWAGCHLEWIEEAKP